MLLIYNFFLTIILLFLGSIIFSKYKFDKVARQYNYWVHCASLGEVKMAIRLIEKMVSKYNIKKSDIILTVVTKTAKEYAKNFHQDTFIFPVDYYFITRKFVKIVKPKFLIILETELWPNYIYFVKKFGGKVFILNGRITKKTYVFLKMFWCLLGSIFKQIDYFLLREEIDYLRFKNLKIAQHKMYVTGNMKYDEIEGKNHFEISRIDFGFSNKDFIICFGSIRDKEEKEILKTIKKFALVDNVKFILAPRHMKLVKKISKLLEKNNIKYSFLDPMISKENKCLIINKYGELKKLYFISDIVFVCGSLLPYGGHNIIEPASLGKLVVFGQYISNFFHPANILLKYKAAIKVKNIEEFNNILDYFLINRNDLIFYGENAKKAILSLKGVTEKNIDFIFLKNG